MPTPTYRTSHLNSSSSSVAKSSSALKIHTSTTTMWNDTHDKIVDYLKFINLIYSAKQNIEICDGCNLNLLNTRYKELYEKDINDFSEFRKCFNDGRNNR